MSRNKNSSSRVNAEVERLLSKKTGVKQSDLVELRNKYDNQTLVDNIQRVFKAKHEKVVKRANKFVDLIVKRYGDNQYPFSTLLEKAHKYKIKYGLSAGEFSAFVRIMEQRLAGGKTPDVYIPDTNMAKILGSPANPNFKMQLGGEDAKNIGKIVEMHTESRSLHSQAILQSMQYQGYDMSALDGVYSPQNGDQPGNHVHPVIAALFLPKIKAIEDHFLYSNISGIVKSRKEGQRLQTRPDYELYYNLVTDPNDVVCNNASPSADLLARVNLQNQLWNSVVHLRNGQYYKGKFSQFVAAVDICRLNRHDNPNLIYGKYDGTVIKRILAAFSFRPLIVATIPVSNTPMVNPYYQARRPSVRKISMINLRVNQTIHDFGESIGPVNLKDALSQNQLFNEMGGIIPRQTSLIHTNGVLIFFVDRRANVYKLQHKYMNTGSSSLPAVSGFDRINSTPVNFEESFEHRNQTYKLETIVASKVNALDRDKVLVVGSETLFKANNIKQSYDPLGVTARRPRTELHSETYDSTRNFPVQQLTDEAGQNRWDESAKKFGIVYIYSTKGDMKELVY